MLSRYNASSQLTQLTQLTQHCCMSANYETNYLKDSVTMEMAESNVFFTSMRVAPDDSVPAKLLRLLKAAGLKDLDLKDKYVAIKTHFGEQGNVTYLKPIYTRTIAKEIKRQGGKPFVTDCSTLYGGMRNDMINHLECAALNGFNEHSCECPVIIGDGLRGTDEIDVPVPGDDTFFEKAHIGRAIMDADVLLTLTHAKGCTAAAYGGVLKNISMGCASKAGKMDMHSKGVPIVVAEKCVGCAKCLKSCGQDAIDIVDQKAMINHRCVGCGHCISYCPINAIMPAWNRKWEDLQMKMGEYAAAVVNAQQCFHVAIAIDITPQCDCFAGNDSPMVPNVGMFASSDPVALDVALTDLICAQPALENSVLPERHAAFEGETDHLHAINPASDWEMCIKHAEELGAGCRQYKIIEVA